jgi:hypothetical protein
MPASLVACPSCSRHHLPAEASCPFCGQTAAAEPETRADRRRKAATAAGLALAATLTAGGGLLAAQHAAPTFDRASPIVDLVGQPEPVEHVAVPCYGVAPPPNWEQAPEEPALP